jgi:hypothetical protein
MRLLFAGFRFNTREFTPLFELEDNVRCNAIRHRQYGILFSLM